MTTTERPPQGPSDSITNLFRGRHPYRHAVPEHDDPTMTYVDYSAVRRIVDRVIPHPLRAVGDFLGHLTMGMDYSPRTTAYIEAQAEQFLPVDTGTSDAPQQVTALQ